MASGFTLEFSDEFEDGSGVQEFSDEFTYEFLNNSQSEESVVGEFTYEFTGGFKASLLSVWFTREFTTEFS